MAIKAWKRQQMCFLEPASYVSRLHLGTSRVLAGLAVVFLGACAAMPIDTGGDTPTLEPPDPRPVLAIEVADDIEVDLLKQQLKLEAVRRDGRWLYFYEAGDISDRLVQYGYQPQRANVYDVFRRVVRVRRQGEEDALGEFGVTLINREETYWVVEGALANLRALERAGFRLEVLGTNEPRPREIRVSLRSRNDVQRIAEMHVDIFSVGETKAGWVLTGAAFDHQIDRMQAAGFEVNRVSPLGQGDRP